MKMGPKGLLTNPSKITCPISPSNLQFFSSLIDDLVKSKISPSRLGVTGRDEGEGDK
jgi:hypothetical protein